MKASTTGYRRQASDILKKHSPKRQHILETWIDDMTDGENDKAEGTVLDQKVARHACMMYLFNVLIELHAAMVNSLLYI